MSKCVHLHLALVVTLIYSDWCFVMSDSESLMPAAGNKIRCRNYDCSEVPSPTQSAACLQLRPCRPLVGATNDGRNRSTAEGPEELRLMLECIDAHCRSVRSTTASINYNCAFALCFRHLITAARPQLAAAASTTKTHTPRSTVGQTETAEPVSRRAGFTDMAGACMAYHCAAHYPGTLDFLVCASQNRCAG